MTDLKNTRLLDDVQSPDDLKDRSRDELKQIADEGLTMPPKSTYIEPKLRSGVVVNKFD